MEGFFGPSNFLASVTGLTLCHFAGFLWQWSISGGYPNLPETSLWLLFFPVSSLNSYKRSAILTTFAGITLRQCYSWAIANYQCASLLQWKPLGHAPVLKAFLLISVHG